MQKFFIVLVAAITLMLSAPVDSPAFFGGGDTTNNYYTTNEGGKGGKGGDATATVEEGAVKVNNFNTNLNNNMNKNDNFNSNYNKNTNTNVNTNINTNKNENKNVNMQGQHQGQNQGQLQGQGQAQKTKVVVDSHDVYEAKRSLPSGGGAIVIRDAPDHMEKATATANEGTVEELMEIRKDFTLGQLIVLSGDEGDIDCDNRAYSSYRESLGHPKKGTKGMDLSLPLTLSVDRPSGKDVGLFVCKGDTETDGIGVIAHAAIEAIRHGATTLYVSANDFVKVLESSGYTIGVGGTASAIVGDAGSNAGGAVIAPKLGYGASESTYAKEAFVRAYGFR